MTAKLRMAFLGFRHGHVSGLYKSARQHPRVEVVAAREQDHAAAAAAQVDQGSYDDLIDSAEIDAVAVGEYFGARGELIIRALERNKHVIADKPICTRLSELERIADLAARNGRAIGCLLDLRDHGPFLTMRRLIRDEAIGQVHTVHFTAQHPLFFGKRPAWYFEPDKQGGTINDICIHATDLIPWLTGRRIVECVAARAWNARLKQVSWFQDAAQVMLKLDNGGGVMGDLSYLAPDGVGYAADQYWRITCHGDGGVVETSYNAKSVSLARSSDMAAQSIAAESSDPAGRLEAFLDEIDGRVRTGALSTVEVLDASRKALLIQQAADAGTAHAPLER